MADDNLPLRSGIYSLRCLKNRYSKGLTVSETQLRPRKLGSENVAFVGRQNDYLGRVPSACSHLGGQFKSSSAIATWLEKTRYTFITETTLQTAE